MSLIVAVVGAALIAVATYDALVATVAVGSGSRPLTAHVAPGHRRRRTHAVRARLLRRVPRALPAGGALVVLTTVGVWIIAAG